MYSPQAYHFTGGRHSHGSHGPGHRPVNDPNVLIPSPNKGSDPAKPSEFGQYSVEYPPLVRSERIPWVTDEAIPIPKKLTEVIAWTDAFVVRAGELALNQDAVSQH
jgi:hypothetical protein